MVKKILAIALLCASTAAVADTGLYAGFGVGAAKGDIDVTTLGEQWRAAGNSGGIATRDRTTGFKIFGGYEFNRYVALELTYADLGTLKASAKNPDGSNAQAVIDNTAYSLEAVGTAPIAAGFSVFGKAGASLITTEETNSCNGVSLPACGATISEEEYNLKVGLGAQYAFPNGMALRLDWDRYLKVGDPDTTGEADIDTLGLSLSFKF